MYENSFPSKRYQITLDFLSKHISKDANILDLGIPNPLSKLMQEKEHKVSNTKGEDLDLETNVVKDDTFDTVTAFEIFEHLVSPLKVLQDIKATKLVASIPLRLWFATAYKSKTDPWDRHYHEFEDWQFDWLLEKAGWEIKDSVQWAHPVNKIGIRPLLRRFTPRYYMVYAERKQ